MWKRATCPSHAHGSRCPPVNSNQQPRTLCQLPVGKSPLLLVLSFGLAYFFLVLCVIFFPSPSHTPMMTARCCLWPPQPPGMMMAVKDEEMGERGEVGVRRAWENSLSKLEVLAGSEVLSFLEEIIRYNEIRREVTTVYC